MEFVGRKKELEELKGLLKKRSASLAVIKGRRRIGKSRLAEEFAKSFPKSILLTGVPPEKGITAQQQRIEFARQMRRQGISMLSADDWGDLFEDLAIHCKNGQLLIILDEITWMGSEDPTFLPKLKTLWDTQFKKNSRLVLLLSGSNSVWIDKNILSSTGFLGRLSYQLKLEEMPLHRCNEFWGSERDQIAPYEKFKILSVTGGIPRYLEELRADWSAEQNLFSMAYRPTGILFNEFDQVFSDLFKNRAPLYREILTHISSGSITMKDLVIALRKSKGGDFSTNLKELEESGFIKREVEWNITGATERRQGYYRISDNYIRFYLKFIRPYHARISEGKMATLPTGWKSLMGLQFENLVIKNSLSLYHLLGLKPEEVTWSGPYTQRAGSRQQGCQVDYLIQSKHQVLYLCEIKFSEREISSRVINEVAEKAKRLAVSRGFSMRYVLIHVNGVCEQLEQSDFFSHFIDFGALLTGPGS
ncbi:Uncharacterized protein SCG7086_AR_00190 [Chlamydiales bacterium SCGC AG-110-P3]|nr:Uncharacterized protein SCG7086_AR_00190 [Chlamydiales bacterium SCGC AG-110-P3]